MKSACSRHTAPAASYEFSSIYRNGCCTYGPANPHPSPLPVGEREQDRRARLQSKAPPRPPCRAKQRHPQAERSDGPYGARSRSRSPAPLRRRGAQRAADQGPRLFERSAAQRVRAGPRRPRAPQSSPAQPDRRSGVAFLWFLSLAKQRKGLARGGEIPASAPESRSPATSSSDTEKPGAALTPTLSQREREQVKGEPRQPAQHHAHFCVTTPFTYQSIFHRSASDSTAPAATRSLPSRSANGPA